jgi:hypothetical protein
MSGRREDAGVEGTFHPAGLAEYTAIMARIERSGGSLSSLAKCRQCRLAQANTTIVGRNGVIG